MEGAEGSEGHPAVVSLSQLVDYSVSLSYRHIAHLVSTLPAQEESHRRAQLIGFIFYSRQLLLRLKAIVRWEKERRELLKGWHQHGRALSTPTSAMVAAADHLFYLYSGELSMARSPLYDVPSAMTVLRHGDYPLLPNCIRENLQELPPLSRSVEEDIRQQLNSRIRAQLLLRPIGGVTINVEKGCLYLKVLGEFRAILTLGYQGSLEAWRLLSVEIFVNSHSGDTVHHPRKITALQGELQQLMADNSSNPLQCLLNVLHDGCLDLAMSILVKQAKSMRDGRWKGIIQVDVQSNELSISYWKKEKGGWGQTLTIARKDTDILVSHEPEILDPSTDSRAQFSLKLESIDLEQMLKQCLQYSAYTILKVESETLYQQKANRRADDYGPLRREGETYSLHLRAYSDVFISLSVSPRNGGWVFRATDHSAKTLQKTSMFENFMFNDPSTLLKKYRRIRAEMLRSRIESVARGFGLCAVYNPAKMIFLQKIWGKNEHQISMVFTFRDSPNSALHVCLDPQKFSISFALLSGYSTNGEESLHLFDRHRYIVLKPDEDLDEKVRQANAGEEPEGAYLKALKNVVQKCRQQIVCRRIAEQLQRSVFSGTRYIPVGSQGNGVEAFSVILDSLGSRQKDVNITLLVRAGVENSVVVLYESPYYADLFEAHLAANERCGRRSQNKIVGPVDSHISLTSSGLEMQYYALDSQLFESITQDLKMMQRVSELVATCYACIQRENELYNKRNPHNTHPLFVLRPEGVWPARFHFVFYAHLYNPNSGIRGPLKVYVDTNSVTMSLRVKCVPDIGVDTFLSQQAMNGSIENILIIVKYLFDSNQAVLTAATEILASAKYPEAIEIVHRRAYHSRIILGGYEGVVGLDIYSSGDNAVLISVCPFTDRRRAGGSQMQHVINLRNRLLGHYSGYIMPNRPSRYLVIPKDKLKSFLVDCHKKVMANGYPNAQNAVTGVNGARPSGADRDWHQNSGSGSAAADRMNTYLNQNNSQKSSPVPGSNVKQESNDVVFLD